MYRRERALILIYLIVDLVLLNLSITEIILHKINYDWTHLWDNRGYFLMLNISWVAAYFIYQKKNLFIRDGLMNRIRRQASRFFVYLAIASILILLLKFENISRMIFFGSNILFFVSKLIFSYFLYRYVAYRRKNGRHVRKILVIGDNRVADKLFSYFSNNSDIGYQIVGFIADTESNECNIPKLGFLRDFQKVHEMTNFQEVIITLPLTMEDEINKIISLAEFNGTRIRLIPDYYHLLKRNTDTQIIGGIPFVSVRGIPLDGLWVRILKRIFDLIFSILVLVFLSPVFAIVALAIKLESKGPCLYKPIRMGKNGEEFKVLKFRSMKVSDETQNGNKSTVLGDSRITSVGAFIRKTNLDELPQFVNVLFGNMSVVGPRPHRINLNKDLQNKMSVYMVRHYVKPGLTGWAQVNGWRGPTETKIQYSGRTLHDIWYIDNWTFWLDIYIIFLTIFGSKVKNNAF